MSFLKNLRNMVQPTGPQVAMAAAGAATAAEGLRGPMKTLRVDQPTGSRPVQRSAFFEDAPFEENIVVKLQRDNDPLL